MSRNMMFIISNAAIIIILFLSSQASSQTTAEAVIGLSCNQSSESLPAGGIININGFTYWFCNVKNTYNYDDARTLCKNSEGYLPYFNTNATRADIKGLLANASRQLQPPRNLTVWIGLEQTYTNPVNQLAPWSNEIYWDYNNQQITVNSTEYWQWSFLKRLIEGTAPSSEQNKQHMSIDWADRIFQWDNFYSNNPTAPTKQTQTVLCQTETITTTAAASITTGKPAGSAANWPWIVGFVLGGVLLVGLSVIGIILWRKKQKQNKKSQQESADKQQSEQNKEDCTEKMLPA